jgi:predicted lysophospholipase L1 biosynthesis ABC-type transport system permease subunit
VKLKPGVSLQAADAEFAALLEQFAKETPAGYPEKLRVRAERLTDQYGQSLGHTLYMLFGAVLVLLFIGCANVSILLLARGVLRQHELAVRVALGGSRARILRQLLTESLVLSLVGTSLGVLFAYGIVGVVVKWLPESLYPPEAAIQVDLLVLCFSIGLALLTGILFGLLPALQLSRQEASHAMKSSTHSVLHPYSPWKHYAMNDGGLCPQFGNVGFVENGLRTRLDPENAVVLIEQRPERILKPLSEADGKQELGRSYSDRVLAHKPAGNHTTETE